MINKDQNYVYLGRQYEGGELHHMYKPLAGYTKDTSKEKSAGVIRLGSDVISFGAPLGEMFRSDKKPAATASDVVGAIYKIQFEGKQAVNCVFTGDTVKDDDDDNNMSWLDMVEFVNNLKDGERVYCPLISLRLLDFDASAAYKRNKALRNLKKTKNDDMLKLLAPIRESMRLMSTRAQNEIKVKILNYLSGV